MKGKVPRAKKWFLISMLLLYVAIGLTVYLLSEFSYLDKIKGEEYMVEGEVIFVPATLDEAKTGLDLAIQFTKEKIIRESGHVNVYYVAGNTTEFSDRDDTNSEAISYLMLWAVQDDDKELFDKALSFVEENMIHPQGNFVMWYLNADGIAEEDGRNLASDADIRMIHAAFIAEEKWGDEKYTLFIDNRAEALENTSITVDSYLAPYAGYTDGYLWTADEVWLSYSNFEAFSSLAERRGEPWTIVNARMKGKTLFAQTINHLYLTQLTEARTYSNRIDGKDRHGIHSKWLMVRSAESNDKELKAHARLALDVYEDRFLVEDALYPAYNFNAHALSPHDTPWAYALVARAAINLDDEELADRLITRILELQDNDPESELYGSLPEGSGNTLRVSQFTMQETILTLQDYVAYKSS